MWTSDLSKIPNTTELITKKYILLKIKIQTLFNSILVHPTPVNHCNYIIRTQLNQLYYTSTQWTEPNFTQLTIYHHNSTELDGTQAYFNKLDPTLKHFFIDSTLLHLSWTELNFTQLYLYHHNLTHLDYSLTSQINSTKLHQHNCTLPSQLNSTRFHVIGSCWLPSQCLVQFLKVMKSQTCALKRSS